MTRKLIVSIIAIVLVAAIIGSCFALYKLTATDVSVSIDATADVCNLTIGTSASLDFAGISPTNNTKTVNITLSTSDNTLADGVSGNFKVAITGDLADAFDATVVACTDDTFATEGDALAAALTNAGANLALNTLPKYYKLTLTLKSAYNTTGFAAIAERTGTITVSWTVVEGSVFTYDKSAYYLVGTVNGVTSWDPAATSIKLDGTPQGTDVAYKAAVSLTAGDVVQVVKDKYGEDGATYYAYGKSDNPSEVPDVELVDDGFGHNNVRIKTTGTYYIFVNNANQIWISTTDY